MVKCIRKQTIIRKEANGTKSERLKCTNGMACTFNKTVSEEVCTKCTLKQIFDCHCHLNKPQAPIYTQPILDESENIVYLDGEPPCPYGYKKTENPLVFEPEWIPCSYLEFSNELNADGSLKVKAYCSITGKIANPQACAECDGALNDITPKDYPPVSTELKNYLHAVKSWISEGRPTRSDEEVAEIHKKYCSQCDWYDTDQQRCKGCGCKTKAEGAALLNKIKMSTQHCPKQLW